MMNHEECVAYINANELNFSPGNYYGNINLKHENGVYYWAIDGYLWNNIPNYLGDALVNYYASNN